jgi:diacylglycerol kinase family enzyme
MPGFLIVNPRAGSDSPSADELAAAAQQLGITAHLLALGEDPAEAARAAPDGPLGIAGGDGSLGAVAAVAIERELPFVCVPFGTRNHFARDVGLDRDDPLAALAAFQGLERRIDVGRANDRVFLNNVSVGMYASLVHRREHHRRRGEALARVRALGRALREWHPRFVVDGEPVDARIILVANNRYRLDLLSLGERDSLESGRLFLYVAHGVVRHSWEERSGAAFEVDSSVSRFKAAFDGEPALVEAPLRCTVEPRSLRLLLPPG